MKITQAKFSLKNHDILKEIHYFVIYVNKMRI